jgi:hypothetical protein
MRGARSRRRREACARQVAELRAAVGRERRAELEDLRILEVELQAYRRESERNVALGEVARGL